MQKVVSNSSPIIHLAKIGKLELLSKYFHRIIIPQLVYQECIVEGKGRDEVTLIKGANFLEILPVHDRNFIRLLQGELDDGESEAITLALEIGAELILLDDLEAREKARLLGLRITGTIGILLRAKIEGEIPSLKEMLTRLKETGFRISDKLVSRLLYEAGEKPLE